MGNEQKLKDAFVAALNIAPEKVIDDLAYQSISEWDSISHMILISQLEESFDVSIDTDDVIDMSSFGKAREILKKYNINF